MAYFEDLGSALAYGGLGILLLVIGYYVIDLLTPGNLGREIVEERSANAAIIVAAGLLAIGAVVTSAITASIDDSLLEGLGQAAGYGLGGIVLQALGFLAVELITPGRLGQVIHERTLAPVAVVLAAFSIALGAILSASIL